MNLITKAFPEFVGKTREKLYDHLKKEGYKLAGEKELDWVIKNQPDWDKDYDYYFFGNLSQDINDNWYVPDVYWSGDEFRRGAGWLDRDWFTFTRVVLIEDEMLGKIIQNYAHDYRKF